MPTLPRTESAAGAFYQSHQPHSPESHHQHLAIEVRRRLLQSGGASFSRLVVRQIPGGICLEGIVECDDSYDVKHVLRDLIGEESVTNRLLVCPEQLEQVNPVAS